LGNLYTLNKTFSLEWKEEQNREENLTHKLGRDLSRKMEEVATDFDTRFFFGGGGQKQLLKIAALGFLNVTLILIVESFNRK